ncbi:hypothetical protein HMPREF0321_2859 [Dermacoccus sp. Ellin185]|nr:hypothetical protein HMPREF0321_2859 [Dermacoccus sp. Ellin185]
MSARASRVVMHVMRPGTVSIVPGRIVCAIATQLRRLQ